MTWKTKPFFLTKSVAFNLKEQRFTFIIRYGKSKTTTICGRLIYFGNLVIRYSFVPKAIHCTVPLTSAPGFARSMLTVASSRDLAPVTAKHSGRSVIAKSTYASSAKDSGSAITAWASSSSAPRLKEMKPASCKEAGADIDVCTGTKASFASATDLSASFSAVMMPSARSGSGC